jgi:hypothetical protein
MKEELELVKIFHEKFKAPILNTPGLIPKDRYNLRYALMEEEVREYLEGCRKGRPGKHRQRVVRYFVWRLWDDFGAWLARQN